MRDNERRYKCSLDDGSVTISMTGNANDDDIRETLAIIHAMRETNKDYYDGDDPA